MYPTWTSTNQEAYTNGLNDLNVTRFSLLLNLKFLNYRERLKLGSLNWPRSAINKLQVFQFATFAQSGGNKNPERRFSDFDGLKLFYGGHPTAADTGPRPPIREAAGHRKDWKTLFRTSFKFNASIICFVEELVSVMGDRPFKQWRTLRDWNPFSIKGTGNMRNEWE